MWPGNRLLFLEHFPPFYLSTRWERDGRENKEASFHSEAWEMQQVSGDLPSSKEDKTRGIARSRDRKGPCIAKIQDTKSINVYFASFIFFIWHKQGKTAAKPAAALCPPALTSMCASNRRAMCCVFGLRFSFSPKKMWLQSAAESSVFWLIPCQFLYELELALQAAPVATKGGSWGGWIAKEE